MSGTGSVEARDPPLLRTALPCTGCLCRLRQHRYRWAPPRLGKVSRGAWRRGIPPLLRKKGSDFEVKSAPFEGTPTSQVGRARGRFSAFPPQHLNEGWFRGVQTHARRRLRPRWPLGREKCARGPLDNSRGVGGCVTWRARTAFWFRFRSHMIPTRT